MARPTSPLVGTVQKTSEKWEKIFLKFDASVAGASTVIMLLTSIGSSQAMQMIAGGSAAVFGFMSAIDMIRIKRLRRDQKKEQRTDDKLKQDQVSPRQ